MVLDLAGVLWKHFPLLILSPRNASAFLPVAQIPQHFCAFLLALTVPLWVVISLKSFPFTLENIINTMTYGHIHPHFPIFLFSYPLQQLELPTCAEL